MKAKRRLAQMKQKSQPSSSKKAQLNSLANSTPSSQPAPPIHKDIQIKIHENSIESPLSISNKTSSKNTSLTESRAFSSAVKAPMDVKQVIVEKPLNSNTNTYNEQSTRPKSRFRKQLHGELDSDDSNIQPSSSVFFFLFCPEYDSSLLMSNLLVMNQHPKQR